MSFGIISVTLLSARSSCPRLWHNQKAKHWRKNRLRESETYFRLALFDSGKKKPTSMDAHSPKIPLDSLCSQHFEFLWLFRKAMNPVTKKFVWIVFVFSSSGPNSWQREAFQNIAWSNNRKCKDSATWTKDARPVAFDGHLRLLPKTISTLKRFMVFHTFLRTQRWWSFTEIENESRCWSNERRRRCRPEWWDSGTISKENLFLIC